MSAVTTPRSCLYSAKKGFKTCSDVRGRNLRKPQIGQRVYTSHRDVLPSPPSSRRYVTTRVDLSEGSITKIEDENGQLGAVSVSWCKYNQYSLADQYPQVSIYISNERAEKEQGANKRRKKASVKAEALSLTCILHFNTPCHVCPAPGTMQGMMPPSKYLT